MPAFKPRPSHFQTLQNQFKTEAPLLGLLILWVLACCLALIGLGSLAIRDFDEAIVARVAYELSQANGIDQFLPTLWGSQYLNKPPGLHWLIASTINLVEQINPSSSSPPNEFVIRFIPALISTLVVPIGGLLQWQLRPNDRNACLATAGILLTILPIARHGRLAMLDGPFLSLMAMLWLLILVSEFKRPNRLQALGIGLVCSAMLLLKAPLLIPAALAAICPIIFGRGLKTWLHIEPLSLLSLGLLPGVSWHFFHYLRRGGDALWLWGGDGAARVLFQAGEGSDLGWKVPLIEMMEGGWPWLLIWPIGILWAWHSRNELWGRWVIGTHAILALAIMPLKTQLPWYSHPLWLPFALACGPPLTWLINRDSTKKFPGKKLLKKIPLLLIFISITLIIFALLGASGLVGNIRPYSTIALTTGVGWGVGSWLIRKKSKTKRIQGIISIFLGSLAGLFLLMMSSFWLWELNESWAVKPAAELIGGVTSEQIAIDEKEDRPSLNWYANQQIRPLQNLANPKWILTRNPELLLDKPLHQNCLVSKQKKEWSLLFCESERR